jgi:hypothetical protein
MTRVSTGQSVAGTWSCLWHPTSENERWFRQLTAQAPFPCDWKGQLFWDSEATKHPHVVDYYLGDGKARLKGKVQDLQRLLAEPGRSIGEPATPQQRFGHPSAHDGQSCSGGGWELGADQRLVAELAQRCGL